LWLSGEEMLLHAPETPGSILCSEAGFIDSRSCGFSRSFDTFWDDVLKQVMSASSCDLFNSEFNHPAVRRYVTFTVEKMFGKLRNKPQYRC
jgi:hypothetical protein